MASIRIGYADYELCPVEAGSKELLLGNQVCIGLVDHYSTEISYRDDLSGQTQLQTILHEAIHVADWQAGDSRVDDQKENEVDRYANFILQFVRDNKEFINLIWEVTDMPCKKKGKKK
jgi:hypothetical protein